MAKTSRLHLPVELWEQCLSYVGDLPSLAAACGTNKLSRSLVRPRMYAPLRLVTDDRDYTPVPAERRVRLELLCRTLSEDRDLAAQCTSAYLWIDDDEDDPQLSPDLSSLDPELCRRILRERHLPTSFSDDLVKLPTKGVTEEYLIIMLFALCPNITSLEVDRAPAAWFSYRTIRQMLWDKRGPVQELAAKGAPFMNIRDVTLTRDVFTDLAVQHYVPFLELPNIRSLRSNRLATAETKRSMAGPPFMHSNVELLDIKNCRASVEELTMALYHCGRLRDLSVEWTFPSDAHRRFDYDGLGELLRVRCPRLERLRLEYMAPPPFELSDSEEWAGDDRESDYDDAVLGIDEYEGANEERPGLGSLKSFEHLKELVVTENALRGTVKHRYDGDWDGVHASAESSVDTLPSLTELLPHSLRRLTVICEDKVVRDKAREFLADPAAASLDSMIVMNAWKAHWFSKAEGEGGVDPVEKRRRRHQRLKEQREE